MGAFLGLLIPTVLMFWTAVLALRYAALFGLPFDHFNGDFLDWLPLLILKICGGAGLVLGPIVGFATGFAKPIDQMSLEELQRPPWPISLFRRSKTVDA